ncbi:MAG: hypothetical protein WCP52_04690 [Bacteroidota bacterium]
MIKYYLPSKEAERVPWLENFSAKIGTYSATFGISASEVSTIKAMYLFYAYIIGLITSSRKFTKALTSYKNTLSKAPNGTTLGPIPTFDAGTVPALTQAGIFNYIAGIVARIKSNNANYTEAIGKELGIIGEETTFVPDDYKANGTCKSMPGFVVIEFNKTHVDGMDIYSNAVGGDPKVFEKIGTANHSPFHDTRPLAAAGVPEKRNYQTRAFIHDAEIGFFSDTFSVTFAG